MKLSDTPTGYLILNARTDSEWDFCDFAIVQIDKIWMDEQRKRLELIKRLDEDYTFDSMYYYETSCQFYQDDCNIMTDSMEFLKEKQWSYLEATEAEIETLTLPENALDCYRIVLKRGGYGMYKCYGKHTSEQFWTADIPVHEIVNTDKLPNLK